MSQKKAEGSPRKSGEKDTSMAPVFQFTDDNFVTLQSGYGSEFDQVLRSQWSQARDAGVMKYRLQPGSLTCKVVSCDRYRFVVALVEGRAPGKRRTPDNMTALYMPFRYEKFNFTKVDPREVLFKLHRSSGDSGGSSPGVRLDATVLVNNSPIEFGSSLLVPSLDLCLPQALTAESIQLALSVLCLTDHQSLRVGFNSPGAMASVNHLHWHFYYLEHKLLLEDLPIRDHMVQGWPAPALAFELTDLCHGAISDLSHRVMRIVDFCLANGQIAYNLFGTRTGSGSVRLFLWLVTPRFGVKDSWMLKPALCELSGYFMCKTPESFETLDEEQCIQVLHSLTYLHHKVLHLLE